VCHGFRPSCATSDIGGGIGHHALQLQLCPRQAVALPLALLLELSVQCAHCVYGLRAAAFLACQLRARCSHLHSRQMERYARPAFAWCSVWCRQTRVTCGGSGHMWIITEMRIPLVMVARQFRISCSACQARSRCGAGFERSRRWIITEIRILFKVAELPVLRVEYDNCILLASVMEGTGHLPLELRPAEQRRLPFPVLRVQYDNCVLLASVMDGTGHLPLELRPAEQRRLPPPPRSRCRVGRLHWRRLLCLWRHPTLLSLRVFGGPVGSDGKDAFPRLQQRLLQGGEATDIKLWQPQRLAALELLECQRQPPCL
jgi:hypothetical protein